MSSKGKRPKPKVFFFCNQKKCSNCSFPQCKHTSDPSYALRTEGDFRLNKMDGSMWQTDISLDGEHYDGKKLVRLGS
jgi:hypothetical protein